MSRTRSATEVPSRAGTSLRAAVSTSAAGRLLATYWGSVVVVDVARPSGPAVTLVALSALVATCSVGQRARVALGLGVVAWLFLTGLVVNAYGDLTVHGADVVRLALLASVAALAAALTPAARGRR